jgi:hypothetical protein
MDHMENMDRLSFSAVVDQVLARRKAENAWLNFIALPSRQWVISKRNESLLNGVDEPFRNLDSHTSSPINKNRIQFPLSHF